MALVDRSGQTHLSQNLDLALLSNNRFGRAYLPLAPRDLERQHFLALVHF